MVNLRSEFFTSKIIQTIRDNKKNKIYLWKDYRSYHNQFERVNTSNAIYIMKEFENKCEIIIGLKMISPDIINTLFRKY